jgi:hypothetical protein
MSIREQKVRSVLTFAIREVDSLLAGLDTRGQQQRDADRQVPSPLTLTTGQQ